MVCVQPLSLKLKTTTMKDSNTEQLKHWAWLAFIFLSLLAAGYCLMRIVTNSHEYLSELINS